ncbi:putative hemolysin [Dysgonomonadaceae bacterium PH5-43]|nr:putative hemolysin [Dysgonomonadaceae bacterium PH5-43]
MDILIIVFLILLNGIFSMSEIAVVSARKTSLKNDAKNGNKAAKTALNLIDNPDYFLSTVQIGITLIGILTGLFSGDLLAGKLSPLLERIGVPISYSYSVAQVLIVIVVTYFSIIFGELVPKRIGLSYAEKIAKIMSMPMHWLSIAAKPFVWILSKSTGFMAKLLGIKENNSKITEEEIKSMIREGTEDGEVQPVEQDIMERVFSLGDRKLESIMTPRRDIVWIDVSMTKEEIRQLVISSSVNKFPVANKSLDNVEGMVFLKDIFDHINDVEFNISKFMHPVQYFYENMEVYSALEEMKTTHNHYALIMNEFAAVQGIVTLKDIMEAMVGEIPTHHDEPEIVERADGSFLIDGQCSFYNFLSYFKMGDLYSADSEYNTLGGLILEQLEHIPQVGETLKWQHFEMEIVDMDGVRIDKVLVKLIS